MAGALLLVLSVFEVLITQNKDSLSSLQKWLSMAPNLHFSNDILESRLSLSRSSGNKKRAWHTLDEGTSYMFKALAETRAKNHVPPFVVAIQTQSPDFTMS